MLATPQNFESMLGAKLQELRQAKKLTLEEAVARAHLSISRSSLSAIENGIQEISAKDLHSLSRVLGFSIDSLFDEINRNILIQKFSLNLKK